MLTRFCVIKSNYNVFICVLRSVWIHSNVFNVTISLHNSFNLWFFNINRHKRHEYRCILFWRILVSVSVLLVRRSFISIIILWLLSILLMSKSLNFFIKSGLPILLLFWSILFLILIFKIVKIISILWLLILVWYFLPIHIWLISIFILTIPLAIFLRILELLIIRLKFVKLIIEWLMCLPLFFVKLLNRHTYDFIIFYHYFIIISSSFNFSHVNNFPGLSKNLYA